MTEKLGTKWAFIAVLLVLTGWILLTPGEGGRGPINLGIDISGGTSLTYTISARELAALSSDERSKALDDTVVQISKRIDAFGTREITVRRVGQNQIQIDAPEMGEAEAALIREQMIQLGNLEFLIEISEPQSVNIAYDGGLASDTYAFDPSAADAQRVAAYGQKKDLRGEAYRDGQRYVLLHPSPSGEAWHELPIVWMANRPPKKETERAAALDNAIRGRDDVDHSLISGRWLYRDPRYWGPGKDGFTGKSIKETRRDFDRNGGRAVAFAIDTYKQQEFGEFTNDNVGKLMVISLNDEVWSSAVIKQKLTDSVQISRDREGFSQAEQDWLVNCLQSGSLSLKPREARRETIGPSLGEIAIKRGIWATVLSFIITIVFMVWYYRFAGLVASLALVLNVIFTLAVVALFRQTLTLPGVAGLILTIGMAVDANILVFERTREEAAKGKKLLESLSAGYDRAFITILDSNLTTALTAMILIWHGTGPIKGFGVTLLAGIVISMFTSLFVTKAVFAVSLRKGFLKELNFRQVVRDFRYPFIAKSPRWIKTSVVLCGMCLALFILTGDKKYGLDFTGGTTAHVRFSQQTTADQVRSTMAALKDVHGKARYEEIAITPRSPTEGDVPAVSEYSVTLRGSTKTGAEEVTQFVQEKFAAAFTGVEGGAPQLQGVPIAAGGDEEWTVEFLFPAQTLVKEVKQRIDGFRDEFQNAPFAGVRIVGVDEATNEDDQVVATRYKLDVSQQDVARGSATQDMLKAFKDRLDPKPFGAVTFIGPNVVATLKESAAVSIILSIAAIILYTWFRFKEVKYGLAASLALLHDVVVPLGVAILCNSLGILEVPINLQSIAAYLTIIGFSINDTIVIFDRVRENLGTMKASFRDIVDISLGQTMSRTILTSLTVLMVVAMLFFFNIGQDSPLEGFAFTMLLGIISGTYSTIFIACPFIVWLHERDQRQIAASAAMNKTARTPVRA